MCGIVGYVGDHEAVPILIGGLAKLEYRGYDSAGVAVLQGHKIEIRRTVGKLSNLQKSLKEKRAQKQAKAADRAPKSGLSKTARASGAGR